MAKNWEISEGKDLRGSYWDVADNFPRVQFSVKREGKRRVKVQLSEDGKKRLKEIDFLTSDTSQAETIRELVLKKYSTPLEAKQGEAEFKFLQDDGSDQELTHISQGTGEEESSPQLDAEATQMPQTLRPLESFWDSALDKVFSDPSGTARKNARTEYVLHILLKPEDVDDRIIALADAEKIFLSKFKPSKARRLLGWQKFLLVCEAVVEFVKSKLPGVKLVRALLKAKGGDQ